MDKSESELPVEMAMRGQRPLTPKNELASVSEKAATVPTTKKHLSMEDLGRGVRSSSGRSTTPTRKRTVADMPVRTLTFLRIAVMASMVGIHSQSPAPAASAI